MNQPTEPEYVEVKDCNTRHGKTKARLAQLLAVVLALILVPCVAGGIGWSAWSKASSIEVKHDAQAEFLRDSLDRIERRQEVTDRDIKMILRNGSGGQ